MLIKRNLKNVEPHYRTASGFGYWNGIATNKSTGIHKWQRWIHRMYSTNVELYNRKVKGRATKVERMMDPIPYAIDNSNRLARNICTRTRNDELKIKKHRNWKNIFRSVLIDNNAKYLNAKKISYSILTNIFTHISFSLTIMLPGFE